MKKSIWEFPQNLIGYIIVKIAKTEYRSTYRDASVYTWNLNGLSLGKYIFVPGNVNEDYIKHEYGHTIQSKYLGWFYLLVIGIPSILWASCGEAYRKKHNISYYEFYTEKWADRLGGVDRKGGK